MHLYLDSWFVGCLDSYCLGKCLSSYLDIYFSGHLKAQGKDVVLAHVFFLYCFGVLSRWELSQGH